MRHMSIRIHQLPALGLAVLLGGTMAAFSNVPLAAHEMSPKASPAGSSSQTGKDDHHHHKTIEIPAGQPVPSVKLVVTPDPMQGWNVQLKVENFRFAPENINSKSLPTEGHAHLYVDGKKVARLYGSWYHLEKLKPGQHKITVSLNANGHEQLTYRGQPIADSVTIQVAAPQR